MVLAESDWGDDSNNQMTISIDGPDKGSDVSVMGYVWEENMDWVASKGRWRFKQKPTNPANTDLDGRRMTVSSEHGGTYTDTIR